MVDSPPKNFEEVCSKYISMAKDDDFEADMNVIRHIMLHYVEDELEIKYIGSKLIDLSSHSFLRGKGLAKMYKVMAVLMTELDPYRPFFDL